MFLSIGTTNVDLFVSGLQEMPAMGGDEFTVDNLTFCEEPLTMILGGNGAIFAYVLAALGEQVAVGRAIGDDTLGDLISGWLVDAGVDLASLVRSRQTRVATLEDLVRFGLVA